MSEEKKDEKKDEKKSVSLDEHKRLLTQALEESKKSHFTWSVTNSLSSYPNSVAPKVTIILDGGCHELVRKLGLQLEEEIIKYARSV